MKKYMCNETANMAGVMEALGFPEDARQNPENYYDSPDDECHCGSHVIPVEEAAVNAVRRRADGLRHTLSRLREFKAALKEARDYAETALALGPKGKKAPFPRVGSEWAYVLLERNFRTSRELKRIVEVARKRGFEIYL